MNRCLLKCSLSLSALFALMLSSPAFAGKQAGAVIIRDEPDYWGYVFPELVSMKSDVVKFHLTYNSAWAGGAMPTNFVIPAAHVNGAVSAGAKDIIFRTAETQISRNQIIHFCETMTFWDTGERLIDWMYNNRNKVHCWIEVGNEPDLEGADPWVHRWNLLDVANNVFSRYSWLWTVHWIASCPAAASGSYVDIFYTANAEGSVQAKYEALGPHEYGDFDIGFGCTNKALSKIGAGKVVWITEAGINHSYDWNTKGGKYKAAILAKAADPKVRGWTFFLLSKDPFWNTCPGPGGVCLRYGIDLTYNTMTPVAGRPCAVQIGSR